MQGQHFTGKHLKIDFIIKPKVTAGWKNANICFGVEFKDMARLDQSGDTKNFSKWLAQCVDYSNTAWSGHGYIYILTCPGILTSSFMQAAYGKTLLARFLAQLGIGELKYSKYYGWTIYLFGDCRLWSEKIGVESNGQRWDLIRKFGSR